MGNLAALRRNQMMSGAQGGGPLNYQQGLGFTPTEALSSGPLAPIAEGWRRNFPKAIPGIAPSAGLIDRRRRVMDIEPNPLLQKYPPGPMIEPRKPFMPTSQTGAIASTAPSGAITNMAPSTGLRKPLNIGPENAPVPNEENEMRKRRFNYRSNY